MTRQEALNIWLQAESDAAWLYPYLGARFPQLADLAADSTAAHRRERDRLQRLVDPDTTTSPADRPVPQIDSVEAAQQLAQDLERAVQAACVGLLRFTPANGRSDVVEALQTAALAELTWGGVPRAFPGLD